MAWLATLHHRRAIKWPRSGVAGEGSNKMTTRRRANSRQAPRNLGNIAGTDSIGDNRNGVGIGDGQRFASAEIAPRLEKPCHSHRSGAMASASSGALLLDRPYRRRAGRGEQ